MKHIHFDLDALLFIALISFLFPPSAEAYVGPGAGLSAIGAFLAVLFGSIIALFGFIWYPLKRLLNKII